MFLMCDISEHIGQVNHFAKQLIQSFKKSRFSNHYSTGEIVMDNLSEAGIISF